MPVAPALKALLDQIDVLPALDVLTTDPAVLRSREKELGALVVPAAATRPADIGPVTDTTVPGPAGPVPVRVYRPGDGRAPAPTVVFFHGGGWLTGDLDTHDAPCRRLCHDLGAVVVAVDYRLAPEHPFPAGYEDCLAAARWVADHIGDYGDRPDRLALVGDSAGGNLAAAVALAFRDEGRPLAAQLLFYPATDLAGDHPSRSENAEGYLLTARSILALQYLYAGPDPAVRKDPRISPLLAEDFRGVAPAVIGTGQYDPLRDEAVAYAEALASAGVDVYSSTYPGLIHAFLNLAAIDPVSDAAVTDLVAELRRRLD
ncbi:alpha/beta hydrolase [Streptomyces sp. NPDC051183]|uniref:alpha/beta hydrolase n=1 Tax=unclassified Streptomyces TaxID=2593676 RepID=UPI003433A5C0